MKTIIVDLDGTLALNKHREYFLKEVPKNWIGYFKACSDDKPNLPVIRLVNLLKKDGYRVHIFSARADIVKSETLDWLKRNEVKFDDITMREIDSFTPDEDLKRQWLLAFYPNFKKDIELVLDDRSKVVSMWRKMGLTCLQVADGDF